MHTHRCVLIEISMEKGMLNFLLGLLVTALMKETYFSNSLFYKKLTKLLDILMGIIIPFQVQKSAAIIT